MKILKLALQNVNSLYGFWEIDFTAPAYSAGLFAITGKTGAGKTTLLDAMMLALYAETPRISSGRNIEVVSRGAPDCLAELTFSAQDGHTYTASFSFASYQRGPKKGQINEKYMHRLAKDGTVIADHTGAVKKLVEEVTGLDKSRFCRTVMLAQGQFDAFLDAGDEKAPILERITGTEIYTGIAAAVKVRNDRENAALELLQKECDQIVLLTEEEEQEKQNVLNALNESTAALQKEHDSLTALKQRLDEQNRIRLALTGNEREYAALTAEIAAFQPQADRLAQAEKAEPLRFLVESLAALKKKNKDAELELAELEKTLSRLRLLKENTERNRQEQTERLNRKNGERENFLRILKQVRELDEALRKTAELLNERSSSMQGLQNDISALQDQKETAEKELADLTGENEADLLFVQNGDPALPEKYAAWQESMKHIASLKKIGAAAADERKKAEQEVIAAEQEMNAGTEEMKKAALLLVPLREQVQACTEKIQRMDSAASLQKQLEALMRNIALIRKFMDLESERRQLEEGKPCPLCGALSHPYHLEEVLPDQQKNESELAAVRNQLNELTELEKKLKKTEELLHRAERTEQTAGHRCGLARQRMEHAERQCREKRERHESLRTEYSTVLSALKQELQNCSFEWTDPERLPETIPARIAAYQQANERLAKFEERKQFIQNVLYATACRMRDAVKLLEEQTERKEFLAEQQKDLAAERKDLFGEKDPDAEHAAFEKSLQELNKAEQTCVLRLAEIANDLKHAEDRMAELRSQNSQRSSAVTENRRLYGEQAQALGLASEAEKCPLLPPDEFTRLSVAQASFSAGLRNLETEKKKLLAELEKIRLPEEENCDGDDLLCRLKSVKDRWQQQSILTGQLRNELEQNRKNRERLTGKHDALKAQQERVNNWGRLYKLIGKGNQFQRIAQGITLDNLLTLANGELAQLYKRYELIRAEKTELGIDVIDREQGGEIRTCDNLSGGERFVVSLALALGLSRMAGEKIRVDSLFLDEGFGTLDAESLQLVMHALGKLKHDGKTVGVISHVSGLSDEIPCNLELTVTGGGRSILSGPGVTGGV